VIARMSEALLSRFKVTVIVWRKRLRSATQLIQASYARAMLMFSQRCLKRCISCRWRFVSRTSDAHALNVLNTQTFCHRLRTRWIKA
jgi:hypothetical protein